MLLTAAASRSGDLAELGAAWKLFGVGEAALAQPESRGLVRVGERRLEFRHPLLRSLVYTEASPSDRRRAHAALAAALASDQAAADERAWHRALAAVGPDEEVARALGAAARRGRDLPTAAAALQRAARLTPAGPARTRRLLEAAEATWEIGAIGTAAPAEQSPRLQRINQPHLETGCDELAPDPAPAGRRLDRHGCDPASPWLGPPSQALPID